LKNLKLWLQDFLLDLERKGSSPGTIRTYRDGLKAFLRWHQEKGSPNVTLALLEEYQMHLMLRASELNPEEHLSISTRNRHTAGLRSFFRYLRKSQKLDSNPAAALETAREEKKLPKVILTYPEILRLLKVLPDSLQGLRDRAIIEVLYATAIRCAELFSLKLSNLQLEEGLLFVVGKGRRERLLPLGGAAVRAITRYLLESRPHLLGNESHQALWVSASHAGPLSDREMKGALDGYLKQANIRKKVTYHVFRHTAATHLLQGGADLRSIQVLLGHARLDTTSIYTRVDISHLREVLLRCHPRQQDRA